MSKAMDDSNQVVTKGFLRTEMRQEFALFRREMREMMQEMLRPLASNVATLQADVADIRHYMKTELVTRSEFHARMDAFAGRGGPLPGGPLPPQVRS